MADTGIVPLMPRDLHALHSRHFGTLEAAKSAVRNGGKSPTVVLLGTCPRFLVEYRLLGQRGNKPSQAVIDSARHPDMGAALAAALGKPMIWFEVLPQRAPLSPTAPPAARPALLPEPDAGPPPPAEAAHHESKESLPTPDPPPLLPLAAPNWRKFGQVHEPLGLSPPFSPSPEPGSPDVPRGDLGIGGPAARWWASKVEEK